VEYYPDKVSRPDYGLGLGSVSSVRSLLTSLDLSIICLSMGINPDGILGEAEADPEGLVRGSVRRRRKKHRLIVEVESLVSFSKKYDAST